MVYVKEEFISEFIEATRLNHKESIKESGNLRFDVLQSTTDITKFMLYEAYESPDAAIAHKDTEHYILWKNKVAPMMAKPREGIPYKILFPTERDK